MKVAHAGEVKWRKGARQHEAYCSCGRFSGMFPTAEQAWSNLNLHLQRNGVDVQPSSVYDEAAPAHLIGVAKLKALVKRGQ